MALKHIELIRFIDDGETTLGRLCVRHQGDLNLRSPWLFTVERPFDGNKPNVSCIPPGAYLVKKAHYNRGDYPTYEVADVKDRTHILFHIANWSKDVEGCIGVGTEAGILDGKLAVKASRRGFEAFIHFMEDVDEAILTIKVGGA